MSILFVPHKLKHGKRILKYTHVFGKDQIIKTYFISKVRLDLRDSKPMSTSWFLILLLHERHWSPVSSIWMSGKQPVKANSKNPQALGTRVGSSAQTIIKCRQASSSQAFGFLLLSSFLASAHWTFGPDACLL